jgi:hypothetical protein
MSLIATAADRLLSAIVPRASAAAWTCPSGCNRTTCDCAGGYWYDNCVKPDGVECKHCTITVWTC